MADCPPKKSAWRFLKRQQVGRQQWRVNWLEDGEMNKHRKLPLPPTIMVQWKNGCIANMRFSYALQVIFHWTLFFWKGSDFVIKCQSSLPFLWNLFHLFFAFFPKMQHVRKINYNAMPIHSLFLTLPISFLSHYGCMTLKNPATKPNIKHGNMLPCDFGLWTRIIRSSLQHHLCLENMFFSPGKDDSLQKKSWHQQKTSIFPRSLQKGKRCYKIPPEV